MLGMATLTLRTSRATVKTKRRKVALQQRTTKLQSRRYVVSQLELVVSEICNPRLMCKSPRRARLMMRVIQVKNPQARLTKTPQSVNTGSQVIDQPKAGHGPLRSPGRRPKIPKPRSSVTNARRRKSSLTSSYPSHQRVTVNLALRTPQTSP